MKGIPASPGLVVCAAHLHRRECVGPTTARIAPRDVTAEVARFRDGRTRAARELERLGRETAGRLGGDTAEIFESHLEILNDAAMGRDIEAAIANDLLSAEDAAARVIARNVTELRALENDYLRERAADLNDIGSRLCACIAGRPTTSVLSFPSPVILVSEDLSPSETAAMDVGKVLGIVTVGGGPAGHAAIIARSLGIPAVVGAAGALETIAQGELVILNGVSGDITARPTAAQLSDAAARIEALRARRSRADECRTGPAVTTDGRRIAVYANIGAPQEAAAAVERGAEGVGLLRSEFLFMRREKTPDADEQCAAYLEIARALGGGETVIRTLDVGGDKPIPQICFPREDNPFLGWRGIRMCLDNADIFETQLEAILRTSARTRISVLFPMVSSVEEVRSLKSIMERVRRRLHGEARPAAGGPRIGIMIETPSAVLMAPELAAEVDFFSIGTNDLTQYVLAVDRGNARIAGLYNPLHPAVIRAIAAVIAAAGTAGIPVCMCGELAGQPLAVPLLVGLGLDSLSMAPPAIAEVKQAIRGFSFAEARTLARRALQLSTTAEIVSLLDGFGPASSAATAR